jgi:hypothetical protein
MIRTSFSWVRLESIGKPDLDCAGFFWPDPSCLPVMENQCEAAFVVTAEDLAA